MNVDDQLQISQISNEEWIKYYIIVVWSLQ
jgi:hypothetical protein